MTIITPDVADFIRENYADMSGDEMVEAVREKFGKELKLATLRNWVSVKGISRKEWNGLPWREHPEWDAFLREYVPGHTEQEIIGEFAERFGIVLRRPQLASRKARLGIAQGTNGGRFGKGFEPANKGKRWADYLSTEKQAACRSTCFKKRGLPHNTRPIGAERVTQDGYVEVHVAQHRREKPNDQWELKQRLVYEREVGPLEKTDVVLFADGDKRNFDPDNLVKVTRRQNAVLQTQKVPYYDRESLETAIALVDLKLKIADCEKRPRKCQNCGREFKPRYKSQKNCDACIKAGTTKRRGRAQ